MKEIYMIWEADWGNTGIFFDDEQKAKEYCEFRNDRYDIDSDAHRTFFPKKMKMFDSMEDYKKSKSDWYLGELKDAIKGLEESLDRIKTGRHYFEVQINKKHVIGLSLKGFETFFAEGPQKTPYSVPYNFEIISLKEKHAPAILVGYEKAKKEIAHLEKKLDAYKKEYSKLKAENRNNNEEKELTK